MQRSPTTITASHATCYNLYLAYLNTYHHECLAPFFQVSVVPHKSQQAFPVSNLSSWDEHFLTLMLAAKWSEQ